MEVSQAVLALNFIDSQLDLSESMIFIVLEIGEGDFENSTLESIVGVLETGRSVYEGFADTIQTLTPALLAPIVGRILSNVEC